MSDAEQIRQLAERYTEAWCSQNAASVAACYEPDGSLQVNETPPAAGREAITKVVQSFMTAFPDMKVEMDDLIVEGDDEAAYHWTLTGTNTGPGGTGKRVRISGFEEWRIDGDGLIAQSIGHFDQAEYERQLRRGVD